MSNENNKLTQYEITKTHLKEYMEKGIDAIPKDVNTRRLEINMMRYVKDNKEVYELAKNKPQKVAQILYNEATLGLDPYMNDFYIIPYKKKDKNNKWVVNAEKEPEVRRDYKADIKLMYKYSIRPVKNIFAEVIYDDDVYTFDKYGFFTHERNPFKSEEGRELVGAYAVVVFENGIIHTEFISPSDIERSKAKSTSYQSDIKNNTTYSPWNTNPKAMWKKTAIKRLVKWVPLGFGNNVIAEDTYYKDLETQNIPKEIETIETVDQKFTEEIETKTVNEVIDTETIDNQIDEINQVTFDNNGENNGEVPF